MAAFILKPIAALLLHTGIALVTGTVLTANPETIDIGRQNPTSRLTISCTPNATDITSIFIIEIGTKRFNRTVIAQIANDIPDVRIRDSSLHPRMTVSGYVKEISGHLTISLSELQCSDATTYYCRSAVNTRSGSYTDEEAVTVTAYPDDVKLSVSPDKLLYAPTTQLLFNCSGYIENHLDENMTNHWVWEWRYVDGFKTNWTPYPYTNNIGYHPPTLVGDCKVKGPSTLQHTVTRVDNGREIRCYVVSPEYGGSKTVYIEERLDIREGTRLSSSAASSPDTESLNTKEGPGFSTSAASSPNAGEQYGGFHGVSLGAGATIGVAGMLLFRATLLLIVYRRRIINMFNVCISCEKKNRPRSMSLDQRVALGADEGELQQARGDEYEIPENYHRLARFEDTTCYDRLRPLHNTAQDTL